MSKITPCLWYSDKAEEAARFYVSLLPDSRIDDVVASPGDWPAGKAGEAIVVNFTPSGTPYQILNGGPDHPHSNAASISVITAEVRLWTFSGALPNCTLVTPYPGSGDVLE